MKIILRRVVNCATSRHGCFIYYCGGKTRTRQRERKTEKDKTESQQRENKRHQTEIDIRNWVATRTRIRCAIYIFILYNNTIIVVRSETIAKCGAVIKPTNFATYYMNIIYLATLHQL